MSLTLVTAPQTKPLNVTDVADHVRADLTAESTLVDVYIGAVAAKAENYTKRALMTQTWELALDYFPPALLGDMKASLRCGYAASTRYSSITLPLAPIQSIESITYIDINGNLQTLDPAAYYLTTDEPAQVLPVYNTSWPGCRMQPGSVRIRYVCGYGDQPDMVPEAIRVWMLLNVANLYENRETLIIGMKAQSVELTTLADTLLDSYRLVQF